jgi:hypothetical protein
LARCARIFGIIDPHGCRFALIFAACDRVLRHGDPTGYVVGQATVEGSGGLENIGPPQLHHPSKVHEAGGSTKAKHHFAAVMCGDHSLDIRSQSQSRRCSCGPYFCEVRRPVERDI